MEKLLQFQPVSVGLQTSSCVGWFALGLVVCRQSVSGHLTRPRPLPSSHGANHTKAIIQGNIYFSFVKFSYIQWYKLDKLVTHILFGNIKIYFPIGKDYYLLHYHILRTKCTWWLSVMQNNFVQYETNLN